MSTIAQNILPIPDSVVVGSGSYTIPADRYAYLTGSTEVSGYTRLAIGNSPGSNYTASANSDSNAQYFPEGSSITTQLAIAGDLDIGTGARQAVYLAYSRILVSGQRFCASSVYLFNVATYSSGSTNFSTAAVTVTGGVGWTASLYRIPKNNLPTGSAEGE